MKPAFRQQGLKKSHIMMIRKVFKEELQNSTIGDPYYWQDTYQIYILEECKSDLRNNLKINEHVIDELCSSEVVSLDEKRLLNQQLTTTGKINQLLRIVDNKGESALLIFITVLCDDSTTNINVELGRHLERVGQYVLD